MAEIDHRILQGFRLADNAPALNMFQNALTAQKNRERQDFEMEQAAAQAPFRNRLLEAQAGQGEERLTEEQKNNRLRSLADFGTSLENDIRNGNLTAARAKTIARIASLPEKGLPTAESRQILDLIDGPLDDASKLAQLQEFSTTTNRLAARRGLFSNDSMGTSQREFEDLMQGFSEEEKAKARRVKAGLAPRSVGSAAQTIADIGTAESVGASQAVIKQQEKFAEQAGELQAKLKLEPGVANAVVTAKNDAALAMKIGEENRSNDRAFAVYEKAMSGLASALGGTTTGPAAGYMPAITSNQQIADGAIGAMAPVLKAIFKTAGEGTFTDSDQALLVSMLPTRKDTPEARKAKLENVDTIIRTKLGMSGAPQATPPAMQGKVLKFNPATGRLE